MEPNKASEVLSGLVERVTFHNPENGFCVLKVKTRGHRDLVSVVGSASTIGAGEYVNATGFWVNDKNHGYQFKAISLKVSPPTTLEGIEKYLASGLIKGIGPVYAKKLASAFGESVFDVIEKSPERLKEIEGIGPVRSSLIIKGWKDQQAIREIMIFLYQCGISTSRAVRIYKTFGNEAVSIISENPYQLARDIRGIGFLSADKIAEKLGIKKDSLIRARAGINYTLMQAFDEGHCGLPTEELINLAEELLEISKPILQQALELEIQSGDVILTTLEGKPCIFLSGLYHAERSIASLIKRVGKPPWPDISADKALEWVEKKLTITLAPSQKEALKIALSSKVLVITGGPGVGKTTLIKSLITILSVKGVKILAAAPTGRAAKRLSESTGLKAQTIHRLLEVNPLNGGFMRDNQNPLSCDLLILDECSMIDVLLLNAVLKALPQHAALILVGDVDQLPSVGPGQVLADIISSQSLPVVRLTEIFRQANDSKIIINAHRINKGIFPDIKRDMMGKDFYFIECEDPEIGRQKITTLITESIPNKFKLNAKKDIQILCPMNRGGLGAHSLNIEIQKVFNQPTDLKVERFGRTFMVGDKVMQITNNYQKDVYNGDIGFVKHIDPEEGEIGVDYEDKIVTYEFNELDELVLAYAITIHKAQGSEYSAVIIPLVTQHYPLLNRKVLYTGVTRGKKLVIIVGQPKALAIAIKGDQTNKRYSKLREWLVAV